MCIPATVLDLWELSLISVEWGYCYVFQDYVPLKEIQVGIKYAHFNPVVGMSSVLSTWNPGIGLTS